MPSNSRAENQYYGKYRECCVVAHLNNSEVEYHENFVFTTEEQTRLSCEAKLIADFLGNCVDPSIDLFDIAFMDGSSTGENADGLCHDFRRTSSPIRLAV